MFDSSTTNKKIKSSSIHTTLFIYCFPVLINHDRSVIIAIIMTAWHGNTFRIAVLLWRESTVPPMNSSCKATEMRGIDVLFVVRLNSLWHKQSRFRWFQTPLRFCDVTISMEPFTDDRKQSLGYGNYLNFLSSQIMCILPLVGDHLSPKTPNPLQGLSVKNASCLSLLLKSYLFNPSWDTTFHQRPLWEVVVL